ncbi:DUF3347 domain-containing protein [Mesonia sp. HuA40]|uniref:DUF3347 domain-containing protein n=1 Tax=Mesonia sp. HuA40 TaxID=2602761 RepID=UPI0011CAB905|nr:DUF3347 domain-containing protein [Mesonia sp. HuA40]TXK70596.1 DUF3347 domain-containing protein [Mesonia sp. HuA40]
MKKNYIVLYLICILSLIACQENTKKTEKGVEKTKINAKNKETSTVGFKDNQTETDFKYYLALQEQLVAGQAEKSNAIAKDYIQNAINKDTEIFEIYQSITNANDIESIREHFLKLSIVLEQEIDKHLNSGTIYKINCPMAFNNGGGFWFSKSEEVLNPYFGDKMLRCGSVTATLRK